MQTEGVEAPVPLAELKMGPIRCWGIGVDIGGHTVAVQS